MSRLYSHIQTAKKIIQGFQNQVPFSYYLKTFFASEKKYGSKDRKSISSICFQYFRIYPLMSTSLLEEKLLVAVFLFTNEPNDYLEKEKPEWAAVIQHSLQEKLAFLQLDVTKLFPFQNEISTEIEKEDFAFSFLQQPKVFARIRPGKEKQVTDKLTHAAIEFEIINEHCLAFANNIKLEAVLQVNKEVVIQDYSSQQTGEYLQMQSFSYQADVWDCCAASGGKSIMAVDFLQNINLTVSDIRPSILHNLKNRFGEAGIQKFSSFECDLTKPTFISNHVQKKKFDIIICDAPCSGSGTWGRTPEQLSFFTKEEIQRYSKLQKEIVNNTIPYLKKTGHFLYITCSVFAKENEDIVSHILQNHSLELIKSKYYKGYTLEADTLFAAYFKCRQ